MNIFSHIAVTIALLSSLPIAAMPITTVLRIKQKIAMEELARSVRDPHSARYRQFYSPDEIRELSAPTTSEYNQLISLLQKQGFTVVKESPTHLWISVRGEVSLFESTFATALQPMGIGLHKPMIQVQIPDALNLIQAVVGLDNTRQAHPQFVRSASLTKSGGIPQATIKTVYGFDNLYAQGLTGQGQHIAIATYSGFNIEDIQEFYQQSNLHPGPSVDQVVFNGTPTYDENSAGETQLDAEFSGMIAPGASIHVFASATNDDAGEAQLFSAILDDNRAKIVNYSWGDCEPNLKSDHKDEMTIIFARAVAQGVNVMVASGDTGSDGCRNGSLAADWPAANPNVVAVGGTTLSVASGKLAETGWHGSGGGISTMFDLPNWQTGLNAQFAKRSYPDVAFNADPKSGQEVLISLSGQQRWVVVGGTSMAAPQWSGFLALVEEARAHAGQPALGFLPPLLYALPSDRQASVFNDVVTGNNGAYNASVGWDAVTGFGSMQAKNLLDQLAN
jgi:kumamolisin